MAGQKQELPVSGEPLAGESPIVNKKKKKKSKKNKQTEENRDLEVPQEVTNGVEEELSNKEKKKKRKREEKEIEKNKKKEIAGDVPEKKDSSVVGNGGGGESEQQKVVVTGKGVEEAKYSALKTFAESNLPENVLDCCKTFQKPSPIQSHTWPFLLDGRDLIGIAKTGSGKTLAFGIPAIMHMLNKNKKSGKGSKNVNPTCLVLSPTRELAVQISDVLSEAGEPCGLKSICVYGGSSKRPQINAIRSGVDIVIGTPGRLRDLIESNELRLSDVSFVVLDEADRMLDMGFEEPVRFILSKTNKVRQMVMFSATWPLDVHKLAQEFMDPNPVKVVIGSVDLAANHDVMQIIEVLDEHARDQRLLALLEKYHKSQKNRVLVFALYKVEAERLERFLQQRGWKAVSIHGNKAQSERTRSLSVFKDGSCPMLVATDVAARGLDIPDVEVVINYSFPLTTEDYVHRIGRTGRAGKKGVAHTFFTHLNKGLAGELVNVLKEAGQVVPADLLKFGTHVKKKESKLYGAHFREIAADAPKAKKITFDNSDDED
ncbi:hypothetical protein CARUB_v10008785mg [Capsella rubella]|uniref:RNA helicase n=1 Tax=Capsella rubella TaxID=81985 RepID=R0GWC7_9BRAS|nr:DEAD-box ATP-dependent RNA helicase 5 [Capsella rubella]EOA40091.1 hypothetical protein CARUB_v10008785mg [Capsella rubella]